MTDTQQPKIDEARIMADVAACKVNLPCGGLNRYASALYDHIDDLLADRAAKDAEIARLRKALDADPLVMDMP